MIIGIHSFKGGSGKTFVALNLGYLLSEIKNVCIIEMDMRAPCLYTFFKTNKYINTLLSKKDSIKKYILRVRKNLSVIPASPTLRDIKSDIKRRDAESIKILKRLQEISSELLRMGFEYIIIDCPPGLSYTSINSMIISDIILFISRPEKAEIQGLELLFEVSKRINKPKYVVLNRVTEDININLPIIAKIPCSCDISMDYPFFVELSKEHEVTKALRRLSEFILKLKP